MTKLMKIALGLTGLAVAVMPATANTAYRSFTVVNNSYDYSVQQVFFAASGERTPWVLADMSQPIAPRSSSAFTMGSGDHCFYDIKNVSSDGGEHVYANVNVCRNDRTLVY
jgi:hypothetical protein